MFRLPGKVGESAVLWTEEVEDYEYRIRVQREKAREGEPTWSMHLEMREVWEQGEDGCEEWAAGCIPLAGLRRSYTTLLLALRPMLTLGHQLMMVMATPKHPRLERKQKNLCGIRGHGWLARWHIEADSPDGEPWPFITFRRPLTADEWACVLGQFAKACDDWDARMGR